MYSNKYERIAIKKGSYLIFFGFLFALITNVYAIELLPSNVIDFNSSHSLAFLKKDLNENTLQLLEHFTTQKTVTYCGIASAVMVLNSIGITAPIDSEHLPYHYFTQKNIFNDQVKKIATPDKVEQKGINLTNLGQIIESYGLSARAVYANNLTLEEFRKILKNAILNRQFIIVNFLRTELQQKGGGHHSPIAAYNETTDRFLVLDVARYKYPSYWVTTEDLWNGINTLDGDTYRGFILIDFNGLVA